MKQDKKEKKEINIKKKKHIFLKLIIFLILIIALIYLYSSKVEVNKLKVKEYKIENENIPSNFDGFKIIQFADINYGSTIFEDELKKIVSVINSQNADLVIFTGNLFKENYEVSKEEMEKVMSILSSIDSNVGKYAVTGINDSTINSFDIELQNAGFKILENNYDLIYYKGLTPIYLAGLSSYLTSRIDLKSAFSYYKVEDEVKEEKNDYKAKYKIALVSESDAVDEIINYDDSVNLILTSNSLGGVIRFNNKGLLVTEGSSKYINDFYKINDTLVYVNNGIGTNEYKIRFNNPPTINLYRLNSIN